MVPAHPWNPGNHASADGIGRTQPPAAGVFDLIQRRPDNDVGRSRDLEPPLTCKVNRFTLFLIGSTRACQDDGEPYGMRRARRLHSQGWAGARAGPVVTSPFSGSSRRNSGVPFARRKGDPMGLHVLTSVRAGGRATVVAAITAALLAPAPAAEAQQPAARAVLVTGASSGLGLRMTEVLSQNGFFVYAGARDPADLARLDAMANVKAVRLDVTVPRDLDAAAALVRAEGRGLYGLINNAGVAVMQPLIEMPDAEMDYQLGVNLLGPFRVTKAFADLLIESRGRILNVSSIAGILAGPFSGAYSMSKHGVEAYTDALAAELARFGVAVAAVEPGNFKSQIVANMVAHMRATGYSAEGSRYGSMLDVIGGPLDRSQFKEPDDVARAALEFLTSEAPRRRYMVVPNQVEAAMTVRQAIQELVQINQGHAFSYGRDDLVRMLDEALAQARPTPAAIEPTERTEAAVPGIGLHEAAVTGDLAAVRRHIAARSDLNAPDPTGGSTPLIIAATFGRAEVARALIDAGADVNRQNTEGSTALLTAALFCHTGIVEALLAAGADRTIPNGAGSTPLQVVTAPFEAMKGIYDYLGTVLGPYGLRLDYDHIRETRPRIAELLR